MKRWMMTLAASLLLALVLGGAGGPGLARAQTSPNYHLSWHVIAGGGQKVTSAGHAVQSTVGQLAIGPGASTHTLGSGYWYGILRAAKPASYGVYLPLVFKNRP